jgi:sec-independent protein translocase protein TatA
VAGFVGVQGIILLVVVFMLLFGVKCVPEAGRSLGRGLREFKQAITGADPRSDDRREEDPRPLRMEDEGNRSRGG